MAATGVGASALGIGLDMLLLTDWAIYLSLSLWLSCIVCPLCPMLCSPEITVELGEAFLTMGNGDLNYAPNQSYAACPYFGQKSRKSTPRRETAGARSTPIPEGPGESSKVRRLQEKARREVDLRFSYLERNSKPGLNRRLRTLSYNLWKIYHVFTRGFAAVGCRPCWLRACSKFLRMHGICY